jgi:hypothetical protein
MTFIAWCGLTILNLGLLAGIMQGCVEVKQAPATLQQIDSLTIALKVDSAAIYRCDTCAFAVAYRRQTSGQVKPCATCAWVELAKPKHNKGDVPELTNQPVNPIHEQDAAQHGTSAYVVPTLQLDSTTTQPPDETIARTKRNNVKSVGDGL